MKKIFTVTVETTDDLPERYPNYRFNYDTPDEFIRARMEEFVHDGFGYTITYKENVAMTNKENASRTYKDLREYE